MILEADEAVEIVLKHIGLISTERVSIFDAVNRVSAERVISRRNLPPFNTSAMDGYAIKAEDTASGSASLKVKGVIAAGDNVADLSINNGECYRITHRIFHQFCQLHCLLLSLPLYNGHKSLFLPAEKYLQFLCHYQ